jgi:hypothetical protein
MDPQILLILGIVANIAQVVAVIWVLFLGARTIPELVQGRKTRRFRRFLIGIFILAVLVALWFAFPRSTLFTIGRIIGLAVLVLIGASVLVIFIWFIYTFLHRDESYYAGEQSISLKEYRRRTSVFSTWLKKRLSHVPQWRRWSWKERADFLHQWCNWAVGRMEWDHDYLIELRSMSLEELGRLLDQYRSFPHPHDGYSRLAFFGWWSDTRISYDPDSIVPSMRFSDLVRANSLFHVPQWQQWSERDRADLLDPLDQLTQAERAEIYFSFKKMLGEQKGELGKLLDQLEPLSYQERQVLLGEQVSPSLKIRTNRGDFLVQKNL